MVDLVKACIDKETTPQPTDKSRALCENIKFGFANIFCHKNLYDGCRRVSKVYLLLYNNSSMTWQMTDSHESMAMPTKFTKGNIRNISK